MVILASNSAFRIRLVGGALGTWNLSSRRTPYAHKKSNESRNLLKALTPCLLLWYNLYPFRNDKEVHPCSWGWWKPTGQNDDSLTYHFRAVARRMERPVTHSRIHSRCKLAIDCDMKTEMNPPTMRNATCGGRGKHHYFRMQWQRVQRYCGWEPRWFGAEARHSWT